MGKDYLVFCIGVLYGMFFYYAFNLFCYFLDIFYYLFNFFFSLFSYYDYDYDDEDDELSLDSYLIS